MTRRDRALWWLIRLAPALLAVACMWRLLLVPGCMGHLNDWLVPPHSFYLADVFRSAFHAWEKHYLGGVMSMKLTTIIPVTLYSSFGLMDMDGHLATKLWVAVFIGGSVWGMASLCRWLLTTSESTRRMDALYVESVALSAGILYGLSPFVFGSVVTGSFVQFFMFPVLPPMLRLMLELAEGRPAAPRVVGLALCFSLVVASVQNYFIMWGLFALIVVVRWRWRLVAACAATAALTCLLNAYSFLPLFLASGGLGGGVEGMDYTAQASGIIRHAQNLYLTALNAGWKHRDLFLKAVPLTPWLFAACAAPLLLMAGAGVLRWRREFGWRERLFITLWIVSVGVAASGKGPFAAIMMLGYENIGATHIFRSPQRLMLLPTLFFAIVVAMLGARYVRSSRRGGVVCAVLVALALVRGASFYGGDLGIWKLEHEPTNSAMDNFRTAPEFARFLGDMAVDSRSGRILFLPVSHSPKYLPRRYQRPTAGGDPVFQSCPKTAVHVFPFHSAYPYLNALTWTAYEGDERSIAMLGGVFSAYELVIRRDVEDHSRLKGIWLENREVLDRTLPAMAALQQESEAKECGVYALRGYAPLVRGLGGAVALSSPAWTTSGAPKAALAAQGPSKMQGIVALAVVFGIIALRGRGRLVRGVGAAYARIPDPALAAAWLALGAATYWPSFMRARTQVPFWDAPWGEVIFLRTFYDAFTLGGMALVLVVWHAGRAVHRRIGEGPGGVLAAPERLFVAAALVLGGSLAVAVALDSVLHGRALITPVTTAMYYLAGTALVTATFPALDEGLARAWNARRVAHMAQTEQSVGE